MELDVKDLVKRYIQDKQLAWSSSTLRSEQARLNALASVLDGDPSRLWAHLLDRGVAPYARVTAWVRVTDFWNFSFPNEVNRYAAFRLKNKRLFRNCYTKTPAHISIEEARLRIQRIRQEDVRQLSEGILASGVRASEARTASDGTVVGKGGKRRPVFNASALGLDVPYSRLYRGLREVGLKPHDLRKIALSKLVEAGANPFELCEAAGWSDIKTAQSYISTNSKRLEELFAKLK